MARPPVNWIEELVAKWAPALRDAFLEAVQDVASRVNIAAVARMLERGDIRGAVELVGLDPVDFRLLDMHIAQTFNAGGNLAASGIPQVRMPEGNLLQVRFDIRNPAAEEWVRARSSRLIGEIVDDQRTTIHQHLAAGLEAGRNPRAVALELVGRIDRDSNQRTGGVIGLHSQQERWLASYAQDLGSSEPADLRRLLTRELRDKRFDRTVATAIRDGKPIPAEITAKMRQAYANRALAYRAETIARTESLAALNEAQRQAYEQGIARGVIAAQDVRRYWHTAGDERVRHTHRLIPGLNKNGVALDEPFRTPEGPVMEPPASPNCRCHVRIKVDFLARVVRRAQAA